MSELVHVCIEIFAFLSQLDIYSNYRNHKNAVPINSSFILMFFNSRIGKNLLRENFKICKKETGSIYNSYYPKASSIYAAALIENI